MKKILCFFLKVSKIWSIVFFLVCLLILAAVVSSSVFSMFQKSQGDKAYQNKDYALALKKYTTARRFWIAERITSKLKYDSLELKTKKAEIMVRSNQNYLDGVKEFDLGNIDSAKNYFLKVVENDPNYDEVKNKLIVIDENREEAEALKAIQKVIPTPLKQTFLTSPKTSKALIDCVGPDGIHFKTTDAECKKLNSAWSSQPSNSSSVTNSTQAPSSLTTNQTTQTYQDAHCPNVIKMEDSLGNTSDNPTVRGTFKKGDVGAITFTITASDPQNLPLFYKFDDMGGLTKSSNPNWFTTSGLTTNNSYTFNLREDLPPGIMKIVAITVDNKDEFTCQGSYDIQGQFDYTVLP